jgi:hypothetical protein
VVEMELAVSGKSSRPTHPIESAAGFIAVDADVSVVQIENK